MSQVLERFLKYVQCDTQSDAHTHTTPSTPQQTTFAHQLADEMREIGMSDVTVDENSYVMGFIPSNIEKEVPVLGFIAHMDTSPDFSGKDVKPRLVEYNGGDILLNEEKGISITLESSPELKGFVGQTLVVTDGTTLLGADDKAGIAEIMTAAEYLIQHPEVKHGKIAICFTPDEEIGEGADHFDLAKFGAKYAYTMDGGEKGCLEYENFNAAYAKVTFTGKNYHPGYAKNRMINSIGLSQYFLSNLPKREVPEATEGYEGFFHVYTINGGVESTEIEMIIRDFDFDNFTRRKNLVENIVADMVKKFGDVVKLEMRDQYANMLEKIEPVRFVVDIARQAMMDCNVKPAIQPIRGGTDGVRLSYMGMPTPNLFSGAMNMHGKYEYVSVDTLESAVNVIVRIAELYVNL